MATLIKYTALCLIMAQFHTAIANEASFPSNVSDPAIRYWGLMYVEKDGGLVEVKRIEIPAIYFPNGYEGLDQNLNWTAIEQLFNAEDYTARFNPKGYMYRFLITAQPASEEGPCGTCQAWVQTIESYCNTTANATRYAGQCVQGSPNYGSVYPGWCVNMMDGPDRFCAVACSMAGNPGLVANRATATPIQLTAEDRTGNPNLIRANAYTGSAGCKLFSGKKALMYQGGKPAQGITRTSQTTAKPLSLCDGNCPTAPSWTLKMVTQDKPTEGFFISTTEGNSTKYLSWSEKTGLTMTTKSTTPTEAEHTSMTWYVGEGALTSDGAAAGYQLLPKASINYAMVVDKETGEVSVDKMYTEELPKEGAFPRYLASPKYSAVWNFEDCKTPPPSKAAKKPMSKNLKN